jgi:D-arabinose 1-dehydrogenase-like Zn-dependent alcohol dehydrogenase
VLIHSAAGGVGSMLVQICKLKGWQVCAVVGRPHKVSACTELGADFVIDKSQSTGLWGPAEQFARWSFYIKTFYTIDRVFQELIPTIMRSDHMLFGYLVSYYCS